MRIQQSAFPYAEVRKTIFELKPETYIDERGCMKQDLQRRIPVAVSAVSVLESLIGQILMGRIPFHTNFRDLCRCQAICMSCSISHLLDLDDFAFFLPSLQVLEKEIEQTEARGCLESRTRKPAIRKTQHFAALSRRV